MGLTINPKKLSLSEAVICFTFKKSAKADFLFDSDLANSMAWLKLLMKSEYISNTTDFEKQDTNTSPIFSS